MEGRPQHRLQVLCFFRVPTTFAFGFLVLVVGFAVDAHVVDPDHMLLVRFMIPTALGWALIGVVVERIAAALPGWSCSLEDFVEVDAGQIEAWMRGQADELSRNSPWILALWGAAAGGAVVIVHGCLQTFEGLPRDSARLALGIASVASAWAGAALALWWRFCRIVWRLGRRFDVVVVPHSRGVRATGRVLFWSFVGVQLIWASYSITALYGGGGTGHLSFLALAVPSQIIFVSFFVGAQRPLHNKMKVFRDARLKQLHAQLKQDVWPKELTEAFMNRVAFLRQEIEVVQELPEWPLTSSTYRNVLGAEAVAVAWSLGLPAVEKAITASLGSG